MKGDEKVINKLNDLLAEELTAINQYFVHAEMCEDWDFAKLHEAVYKRAIVEMKHAEKLIERILFLEGRPVVSQLNKITIGETVPSQLDNDINLEYGAVKQYNEAVAICVEAGDNGTKELVESILHDEEDHVDEIEGYQDQMELVGTELWLAGQA
jgi:bacterioferritin